IPLFLKKGLVLFFALFSAFSAHAVKVHFPDEELAVESVLPLVDTPEVALNRNIRLKFRTELNLDLGIGLDEPFYFKFYPMGSVTFHLTEIHAVSLMGAYFIPKLSSAGEDLKAGEGLKAGTTFDPLKAPYPQLSVFLSYLYIPYYGKISLAKSWALNLSIYAFVGGGLVVSNKNDQFPALNLGFGKKLYFNKWLGAKTSLGFYSYYGPATAKLKLDELEVSYSSLKSEQKRLNINTIFHFGVFGLL
ncbi:MAG: hypothetical protein OXJ52_09150, partial [Oligoflexia bacterium]|nr:hypothetical protein [Oligoflexia bacterium]